MTRLQKLHEERSEILMMQTLSYELMEKCREWYDNEIECIEKYGAPNPEMREKENKE